MKNITHTVTTPIIYGHPLHIHHAEYALKNKAITAKEFSIATGKYANAIFSGHRMSEQLSEAGNKANVKIHLFILKNNPSEMEKLFSMVLARELNAKYHEFNIWVEKDGTFTADHEKSILDKEHDGRHVFIGTYVFDGDTLTIQYEEE